MSLFYHQFCSCYGIFYLRMSDVSGKPCDFYHLEVSTASDRVLIFLLPMIHGDQICKRCSHRESNKYSNVGESENWTFTHETEMTSDVRLFKKPSYYNLWYTLLLVLKSKQLCDVSCNSPMDCQNVEFTQTGISRLYQSKGKVKKNVIDVQTCWSAIGYKKKEVKTTSKESSNRNKIK